MTSYATGGAIHGSDSGSEGVPCIVSPAVAVFPYRVVARYGREFLAALTGTEILTAEEVLAEMDEDEGT